MSGQLQTQALAAALATVGQLASDRQRHQRDLAIEELRAGALSHLVDALVVGRVDAVKSGFVAILGNYAEQARHFMAQQQQYAMIELDCDDPLKRVELRNRLQDIDHELATIRIEAALLYERMIDAIESLGGVPGSFAAELSHPLALPMPS